jgi:hypothetical protein
MRREPHIVVSGERCKQWRLGGHDQSEGRIMLGGRRHTKANDISISKCIR